MLRNRLDAERDALNESHRDVQNRLQAEIETMRIEHSRRLQASSDEASRLRDELRIARGEIERLQELRARERAEAEGAALRSAEITRASIAQVESKMAATASQHSLELERARKELLNERSITQEIVTEAKQEAATAMAQTLEAREDALRWQRALAAASPSGLPPIPGGSTGISPPRALM